MTAGLADGRLAPSPHPTDEQRQRVGEAARRLVELRDNWLNPPVLTPAELESLLALDLERAG